jgi:hypothetical protein
MQQKMLSQIAHFVTGVDPVADLFGSGTATNYSDVVSVKQAHAVHFLVWTGVGSTGTATLTVQACDDTTPSNRTAIAFRYRKNIDTASSDVFGAMTTATTAGFNTTAAVAGQMYLIEVDADLLAPSGYSYCQLKMVEVVNDPVLGGVLIILAPLAYERAITATQVV